MPRHWPQQGQAWSPAACTRWPHGQGKHRWTERLETEVVGITALTTYDQYGPEEHAQHQYRKDFEGHPLNAVVVRKWHNRDYGPGGKVVFLTNEAVAKPLKIFDTYDDRSLIENCCIKERKQAWNLKHPPKKTRTRRPGTRLLYPGDVCTGHGVPLAG